MFFKKIGIINRDIIEVYKPKKILKFILISLIFVVLGSLRATDDVVKELYSNILGLFSVLIVVEIAFFGLFFSENPTNIKAKKFIINTEENISYYQSLVVKNFHSITLKIINIVLIYMLQLFNLALTSKNVAISSHGICFSFKVGPYLLFYFLFTYALIVMMDLVVSIYFYLWKN